MSERIDAAVARIKTIMLDEENNINDPFTKAVDDLFAIDDPEVLSKALMLFDEHFDLQDLMWLVLHRAEKSSPKKYVTAYLSVLPELSSKSPEWSERIMGRCLNSEPYRKTIKAALGSLSSAQRKSVVEICEELKRKNPRQFGSCIEYLFS